MKNAIIYCRVSTTEQKDNGYSLKEQERHLIEYCKKNNIKIIKKYIEDYSAKNFNRPEFFKLFKYATQNKSSIDYLLVYKWDRFSRNVTESYEYIDKFQKLSIEVNSINEWIEHSNHMSQYMLAFSLVNPDVENRVRKDRVTTGMRASMKEGRWCANAPTGYKNERDSNKKPIVVINDDVADEVRNLFKDFSTGMYSQVDLIEKYKSEKFILNKAKLSKMLKNRFYVGEIYIKATETEPEEIVKGLHEPLISKEVFENVQRVLKGRRPFSNNVSQYEDLLPLRGLLVNDKSGKKLTGTTKTKENGRKYSYYHSNSKDKIRVNVSADVLHEQVESMLMSLEPKSEIKELLLEMIKSKSESSINSNKSKVKSLEKEISELGVKKDKLMDNFLNDVISKEDFELYNSKFSDDIKNKKDEVRILKEEFENIEEYFLDTFTYLENLSSIYNKASPKGKKALLSSILEEKLRIYDKKYRTPRFKGIIKLICRDSKTFKGNKNNKGNSEDEELPMVHPKRFELQTF